MSASRGAGTPPEDEIATYLHHDGPLVIFPMPGGRSRVITELGKSDPNHSRADPTLEEVHTIVINRANEGIRVSDPVWLSNFRINERKVERYGAHRVLLAGDAAHVHSPAGGLGMNTGIQDAVAAAWLIALVMRGPSSRLIDSYSLERRAVGEMVLRNATRLTDDMAATARVTLRVTKVSARVAPSWLNKIPFEAVHVVRLAIVHRAPRRGALRRHRFIMQSEATEAACDGTDQLREVSTAIAWE